MDIRKCRVSKAGLEHVVNFNRSMEAEMCERCMKTREEQAIWDKEHKLMEVEMSTEKIEGDVEIFEEIGKEDPQEIYREGEMNNEAEIAIAKSKAILHHKLSPCPQCGIGDLWAVCTVKNFETEDYSPECDYCGYAENK